MIVGVLWTVLRVFLLTMDKQMVLRMAFDIYPKVLRMRSNLFIYVKVIGGIILGLGVLSVISNTIKLVKK